MMILSLILGLSLLIFLGLDLVLIISLLKPGDERSQAVVWKASSFTLLAMALYLLIAVIEDIVRAQAMSIDPFVLLETTAIVYLFSLLYYKRRHGG